ncbi:hypothetical protein BS50DRAFT_593748 [Corynespora cassiicola Philippines]|uniref:Uncharacterized protein n=1 Tax=Corynespora cassiicola Philippines TaxID=1448308 RepID=A0A2T2N5K3_CORCC|nr:hypothetical protein BS50DRAFT_593748 [Corynespora cassiicola Philippines]
MGNHGVNVLPRKILGSTKRRQPYPSHMNLGRNTTPQSDLCIDLCIRDPYLTTYPSGRMDMGQGVLPVPREFEEMYRNETSNIYVFSGGDHSFEIRDKLDLEFKHAPLNNPMLELDVEAKNELSQHMTMVYMMGFFNDDTDFAFYYRGLKNIQAFMGGTFTSAAYRGPCFATPVVVHTGKDILQGTGLEVSQFNKVNRTETKGARWRYLYETARIVWEKLAFDEEKKKLIDALEDRGEAAQRDDEEEEEEERRWREDEQRKVEARKREATDGADGPQRMLMEQRHRLELELLIRKHANEVMDMVKRHEREKVEEGETAKKGQEGRRDTVLDALVKRVVRDKERLDGREGVLDDVESVATPKLESPKSPPDWRLSPPATPRPGFRSLPRAEAGYQEQDGQGAPNAGESKENMDDYERLDGDDPDMEEAPDEA